MVTEGPEYAVWWPMAFPDADAAVTRAAFAAFFPIAPTDPLPYPPLAIFVTLFSPWKLA